MPGIGSNTNALTGDIVKLSLFEDCYGGRVVSDSEYWERSFISGSAKLYVLSVLSKGRLHGYGVLKEIKDKSEGCCTITPGTIYPILRELKKEGLIISNKDPVGRRVRITYEITEMGRQVLENGLKKWESTSRAPIRYWKDNTILIS